MPDRRDINDEEPEKIPSDKKPGVLLKRKKRARNVVLADIVIIAIILAFVYRHGSDTFYSTTQFSHDTIHYRFSLSRGGAKKDYIFTLSVENKSGDSKRVVYQNSIAEISLRHADELITRIPLGEKIKELALMPGETRTFIQKIGDSLFADYARDRPDRAGTGKVRGVFISRRALSIDAIIVIQRPEKLSGSISFDYSY